MWALLDIIIHLKDLIIWRGCSPLSSLVICVYHWIILLRIRGYLMNIVSFLIFICTLKVFPIYPRWDLWWFTELRELIRLSHHFINYWLPISVLLNGRVWVWVFKSCIQSDLCWLWSLFRWWLHSLEVAIHGSSSWFQLLQSFSLALLAFKMLLFSELSLLAGVGSACWTFVAEGSDHIMRCLIACLSSLLLYHVRLIRRSHHGGWRSNTHLV